MKKTSVASLLAALILLAAGCNTNENQIRKIAYGYLDAMGNYRIDEAYPYATEETQKYTLDFLQKSFMALVDTASIMLETPAVITITSVTMTSDTTASVMFHKSTPVSERNNLLDMVKRDGKWYANVIINQNTAPDASKQKSKHLDSIDLKNTKFKVVHKDSIN